MFSIYPKKSTLQNASEFKLHRSQWIHLELYMWFIHISVLYTGYVIFTHPVESVVCVYILAVESTYICTQVVISKDLGCQNKYLPNMPLWIPIN